MNLPYLEKTAGLLQQPSQSAAVEFASKRDSLAEELNHRMMARADLHKMIGEGNSSMMQDNSRNFTRFMSSMFTAYEPLVLVHTALWVFRAYRSHGFQTTYWAANLDAFVQIAAEKLSAETYAELYPFFNWLIVNVPVFVQISNEQMGHPLHPEPGHDGG